MYRPFPQKRNLGWQDLIVAGFVAVFIYAMVGVAHRWVGIAQPVAEIDLSPHALPWYALLSMTRGFVSYGISLLFTLIYGYIAAKSRNADRVMIPLVDVLQSIPVLGFLPGLITGLSALFPGSNIGLELTAIFLIFTGQAWNMTYSFYSSVRGVPSELQEAATVMHISWWQRLKKIELPFSAIPLAWNSLVSMAGGWFFLTVCESFTLGDRHFQLPGVGSYMAVAIQRNDHSAMSYGILAMIGIILFSDFLVWRPVMAWVQKFQMEDFNEDVAELPFVTSLLRESKLLRRLSVIWKKRRRGHDRVGGPKPTVSFASGTGAPERQTLPLFYERWDRFRENVFGNPQFWQKKVLPIMQKLALPAAVAASVFGVTRLWELVRTLEASQWRVIWGSVGLTFARVVLATIVGALWTVPVAVLIGMSPRITRILQPFVQLLASFPAPMLFPVVLALMFKIHLSLHWGSALLMMLGVQWYILFNVLAGTMSVTRDLKDSMANMHVSRWVRWKYLYLPAAFPSLVNGLFNAAGGAWNASIVAEYLTYDGKIYMAPGIGSLISRATADGNFPLLAGSLIALVVTVVGLNQTFWRWLQELADNRFRFER